MMVSRVWLDDALTLRLTALPTDGSLQKLVNNAWTGAAIGDRFTQADIAAGNLRFVPASNAAGGNGYTTTSYGNQHQHYARLSYTVSDGQLSSARLP